MIHHETNGWFWSGEFLRAMTEIHKQSTTNHLHWMGGPVNCKYIQVYVDQRTGDFILRDADGKMLTHEQVYTLFPALQGLSAAQGTKE